MYFMLEVTNNVGFQENQENRIINKL